MKLKCVEIIISIKYIYNAMIQLGVQVQKYITRI